MSGDSNDRVQQTLLPLVHGDAADSALVASGEDILIVDDRPGSLVTIDAALSGLGRRVVSARSGDEALARLLAEDFGLIVLDVQMPSLGGFETARLIRSRERNRYVPIIFITGGARDDAQVLEAYALGALDFLYKPVHPEVLRAKASVLIALQQRARRLAAQSHEQERQRWEADALRKQTEEVRRINAQLAAADRRKDEFLAVLGHELRNPLAPIRLALELIGTDEPLGAESETTRAVALRQVVQLTHLVDELLDVSRITAGKIELRPELLAVSTIVEQAIAVSRPLIDGRGHALRVQAGSNAAFVNGDLIRLVQVVANLLNNAARYTMPGGWIEVAFGALVDEVFVRVTDNGCGMRSEALERVFDMFVQERPAGASEGGLGLGLTLARRLVALHDGRIGAHSEGPGRGAAFEVRLPAAAPPALVPQQPGSRTALSAPTRKLRIAVIDDNKDIRRMMSAYLRFRGHEVETAPDGPSGLDLILRMRPDVAFVDVGLPGIAGHEVAQRVRAELGRDGGWLVALTGYGQDSDCKAALDAGFDLYLRKPASTQALEQALAAAPRRD